MRILNEFIIHALIAFFVAILNVIYIYNTIDLLKNALLFLMFSILLFYLLLIFLSIIFKNVLLADKNSSFLDNSEVKKLLFFKIIQIIIMVCIIVIFKRLDIYNKFFCYNNYNEYNYLDKIVFVMFSYFITIIIGCLSSFTFITYFFKHIENKMECICLWLSTILPLLDIMVLWNLMHKESYYVVKNDITTPQAKILELFKLIIYVCIILLFIFILLGIDMLIIMSELLIAILIGIYFLAIIGSFDSFVSSRERR